MITLFWIGWAISGLAGYLIGLAIGRNRKGDEAPSANSSLIPDWGSFTGTAERSTIRGDQVFITREPTTINDLRKEFPNEEFMEEQNSPDFIVRYFGKAGVQQKTLYGISDLEKDGLLRSADTAIQQMKYEDIKRTAAIEAKQQI